MDLTALLIVGGVAGGAYWYYNSSSSSSSISNNDSRSTTTNKIVNDPTKQDTRYIPKEFENISRMPSFDQMWADITKDANDVRYKLGDQNAQARNYFEKKVMQVEEQIKNDVLTLQAYKDYAREKHITEQQALKELQNLVELDRVRYNRTVTEAKQGINLFGAFVTQLESAFNLPGSNTRISEEETRKKQIEAQVIEQQKQQIATNIQKSFEQAAAVIAFLKAGGSEEEAKKKFGL